MSNPAWYEKQHATRKSGCWEADVEGESKATTMRRIEDEHERQRAEVRRELERKGRKQ